MCLSMTIVNVMTTAVYYGVFRFTHCFIEIFLVPSIAFGLQRWWDIRNVTRTVQELQSAAADSIGSTVPDEAYVSAQFQRGHHIGGLLANYATLLLFQVHRVY
jgi:hypothetical protein